MQRTTIATALVCALALPAAAQPSAAQNWPTRPLTMVVPFAPGGATDSVGRIFGAQLSEILRQQVIIENAGGAGGMNGAARVAKAPPDGYQFVHGNTGTHAHNQSLYKNPLYNAATDFAPVALIVDLPVVLITRPDFPADDLPAFIAYLRANQAKLQYSSGGAGSSSHLACALLNAAIGVKITHIPYRGGGPAMADLMASRTDYQCGTAGTSVQQIDGKLVKAIAVLAKGRSSILPNVKTAHEQGLKDFTADFWTAFFLPKDTPRPIVQRLNEATVAAMNSATVKAKMAEIGADLVAPERRSPEYLQTFVESQIEKWAGPIKAAGVTGE